MLGPTMLRVVGQQCSVRAWALKFRFDYAYTVPDKSKYCNRPFAYTVSCYPSYTGIIKSIM